MRSRRSFTLLEVVICIALLGMAAVAVGYQFKDMLTTHHFHKNIDNLMTDLKKIQLLAMADRCDIQLDLFEKKGEYLYKIHADEPLLKNLNRTIKLSQVKKIAIKNQTLKKYTLHISSSGRIEPEVKIDLYQKAEGEKRATLDLTTPLSIKLS